PRVGVGGRAHGHDATGLRGRRDGRHHCGRAAGGRADADEVRTGRHAPNALILASSLDRTRLAAACYDKLKVMDFNFLTMERFTTCSTLIRRITFRGN